MARLYDNLERKFNDGLRAVIGDVGVKRADFCVGYFNLRGWDLVADQVEALPGDEICENNTRVRRVCRLLIGMHRPPRELIRDFCLAPDHWLPDNDYARRCRLRIAADFRDQLLLGLPTGKDELTLRKLLAQLKAGKVAVKLYLREPLHAKLYLAHRPDDYANKIISVMGSSNLTYSGLTGNGELNAEFTDSDLTAKLARWFDERWNDRFCLDITQELVQTLENSWACAAVTPYQIYLMVAYHLSRDVREGGREFAIPPEFRSVLFEYQATAVKMLAKRLAKERLGGAMLGDVVGLGKTLTACAVAKIFENASGATTLILCPANLQDMWRNYIRDYDLKADVKSQAENFDPDQLRLYRFVIIDESHNLMNPSGARYRRIRSLIAAQGPKTLLLTATPYNKDYTDLSGQLRLFIPEDADLGIRPENYIQSLGGERGFMRTHSDISIRSLAAFEKSPFGEDWSELMKLCLVRRTRTFIKNNYAQTDPATGRKYLELHDGTQSFFPDRRPHSVKFATAPGDQYNRLYSDEMVGFMEKLCLPRYGLEQYLDPNKAAAATASEKRILENLTRAGRRIMGFCRSTFFKRMDSSGSAFLLTLYRHILRNAVFLHAINNNLPLPIGDENELPESYVEDSDANAVLLTGNNIGAIKQNAAGDMTFPDRLDTYLRLAEEHYAFLRRKDNVGWIDSTYFKRTLKQKLTADCEVLLEMLRLCGAWQPAADPKLAALEHLIRDTHPTDKVLIFTQYSDTADYLHRELKRRGFNHLDVATGESDAPTASAERFSPKSNKAAVPPDEETRILVATDVLSEGQNLQDAHVVVNFDMPWAIIRLIQRVGRVDRIGQDSPVIDCYSFFPADGIEKLIRLRSRLNDRINTNAGIVGSDEIFFEGNEQNLRDLYNENSGSLDEDDGGDVDLASQAFQAWNEALHRTPEIARGIPKLAFGVHATRAASSDLRGGAIAYARTYTDLDVLTWRGADNTIVTQSQQRIFSALACAPDTPSVEPLANHHDLVAASLAALETGIPSYAGSLGNRFSTRYKLYERLQHYHDHAPEDLFNTADRRAQIARAIDEIFRNPLTESAKHQLGPLLRTRNEEQLIDTVLELRDNGCLCPNGDDDTIDRSPKLICSLGLNPTA